MLRLLTIGIVQRVGPVYNASGCRRFSGVALGRGPYRLFFYSDDRDEPPHVHVERDANLAKFWLSPVRIHDSGGFRRGEINRVRALIVENEPILLEAWHEFFSH